MVDFSIRSQQTEWMDDPTVSSHEMTDCLLHLQKVNTLTFAYYPTLHWLATQLQHSGSKASILDVGSGGGDMLRRVYQRFKTLFDLNLLGVDLNPLIQSIAVQLTPPNMPIRYQTGDIFAFDDTYRVDYIISSLVTHHMTNEEILRFLQWMTLHSNKGWFINDLHRHRVAWALFRMGSALLRIHPMVQHDGALSVRRAFTKKDWQRLLTQAGIAPEKTKISWVFPFRYCVEFLHE